MSEVYILDNFRLLIAEDLEKHFKRKISDKNTRFRRDSTSSFSNVNFFKHLKNLHLKMVTWSRRNLEFLAFMFLFMIILGWFNF